MIRYIGKSGEVEGGAAIGMNFAPANANLFMGRLEERLLEASVDKPLV